MLPKRVEWVSIQNVNPRQPWYWEMQDTQERRGSPDWRDVRNEFRTGCTVRDRARRVAR